ncbi:MAG: hypothetical protein RL651_1611 [Pseudomonadota bacterium]|jgi:uncharacterized membrane protein SirB2
MEYASIYKSLKHAHVSFVVLSYLLFVFRGWLAVSGTYRPGKLMSMLVHGVDTLLLLLGVSLAVVLQINPFVTPWLSVKLIALVGYILMAAIWVRRGKTKKVRLLGWVVAQVVFLYIVLVAITKNPLLI